MDIEEEILGMDSNPEYSQFDKVIGLIEEIVVEDDFQHLQKNYFDENCSHFDDCEENKLIYTDIHNKYTKSIEEYIEQRLISKDTNFSMNAFLSSLSSEKVNRESEIMELLLSLSDFNLFKETMLAHKMSIRDGMQLACGDFFQVVPLKIDDFEMNKSNNYNNNASKKPEDQQLESESSKTKDQSSKKVEMMMDNLGDDEVEKKAEEKKINVEEKKSVKKVASVSTEIKKSKKGAGTLNNSYNRQKQDPKKDKKYSSYNFQNHNNNDTTDEGVSKIIKTDEHAKTNSKLRNPFANLSLSKVLRRHK